MRKRHDPSPIGPVLDDCLDRAAGEPGASAIWRVWDAAVGAQIARRAQPVRLRGRTLVVAVSSAPWMQELQMLKRSIVAALAESLPRALVDDLYFVLTEHGPAGETRVRARRARTVAPPPAAVELPALPESLRRSFADVLAAWRRRAGA